jgi:hypothetical protein
MKSETGRGGSPYFEAKAQAEREALVKRDQARMAQQQILEPGVTLDTLSFPDRLHVIYGAHQAIKSANTPDRLPPSLPALIRRPK